MSMIEIARGLEFDSGGCSCDTIFTVNMPGSWGCGDWISLKGLFITYSMVEQYHTKSVGILVG